MASDYKVPPRAGFDYQDIVALHLVVEIMTHPDRYQWIQVERDNAGSLDDVTALRGDGGFIYWQVKFSVDPAAAGDPYNWKKLLEQEKGENGPKDSLLMKWGKSLKQVMHQGPLAEAALITNRKASADLQRALNDSNLVDFNKIPKGDDKREIRRQFGSIKAARAFFSKFHFKMDQQGLDTWEESVKRKFELLGGTAEGWLSLKDNMRTWSRERNQPAPDGLITLEKAREAALWKVLQRMPQEFEIPSDYVVPSEDFHNAFMEKVSGTNQRCIVLTAPPGTGKSTYLSYVTAECRQQGIPVVRHHYFLSLGDRTPHRLFHRRVAESLMNDLTQLYPESLGSIINTNPNPDDLGQWVDQCGKHFVSKGQCLIVIIDGLDHVARDKGTMDDVRDLLDHLLPPPEGVTIVFGTQPLEEPNVPKKLLDHAPRNLWEQLPCLDRSRVRQWVEKNSNVLGFLVKTNASEDFDADKATRSQQQAWESQVEQDRREADLDNLARAFWTVSEGHPLHLRYCLNYLQENGLPITPTTVMELPACSGGNIEQYYRDLFDSVIHERGRQILHLMAACRFDWPEKGVLETVDPDGTHRSDFVQALKSIKHLTRRTDLGLSAFHSSLLYYIENREDHKHYRDISKQKALDWLCSPRAPEYLRWAHEWMLLADLGDTEPLIGGPDRAWAVNSVMKRFPPNETLRILSRSCRAALEKGSVSNYLKTALLRDYVDWLYEGHEEALEALLEPQLIILRGDEYLLPRLKLSMPFLSPAELVILARDAADRGDQQLVGNVFDHLNERIGQKRMRLSLDDPRQPLLQVAALCKDVDPTKVVEYIDEEEQAAVFPYLANVYASELRRSRRVDVFRRLFDADLEGSADKEMLQEATLLALEERLPPSTRQRAEEIIDPYTAVWMQLSDAGAIKWNFGFPHLTCRERELYHGPGAYESRKRATIGELREAFFCFLAHHLAGQPDQNEAWLATISRHLYEGRFLHKLNEISRDLAATVRHGVPPSLGFVFERLRNFEKPQPGPDAESWDLYRSIKRTAIQVGLDVMLIGQWMGARSEISQYEIELAFNSEFCDWQAWVEIYLPLRRAWMSKEALEWLLSWMGSALKDSIDTFANRALSFAQMAVLASSHGFVDHAVEWLRLAAENLLGYGYHKDILLFEALDVVSDCHDAGIQESRNWVAILASAVAHVSDFTDGGETRHLPEHMAKVLARMDKQLLLRYYDWLLSQEEYYVLDKAFAEYLNEADLSSVFDRALASTTLEAEGLAILARKANEGDEHATESLFAMESYLGSIPRSSEESRPRSVPPSGRVPPDDDGPQPSDYPPDRFTDYVTEVLRHPRHHFRAESWVRYWCQNRRPTEAFEAVRTALDSGIQFHVSDDLFELALMYLGSDLAFDWLVQAHGRNNGWRKYWGPRERAVRRWETVKQRYPERWLEFLLRSIAIEDELAVAPYGKDKIQRLVQYSISMGQDDMATELGEVVMHFICELLSPITLPSPGWVPKNV